MKKKVLSMFLAVIMAFLPMAAVLPVSAEPIGQEDEDETAKTAEDAVQEETGEAAEETEDEAFMQPFDAGDPGLWAEYFLLDKADLTFEIKKAEQAEEQINHPKGNNQLAAIMNSLTGQDDYVGIRWTGKLSVPEDGLYTFYGYSDNGIRLYLDHEVLIDWWSTSWDVEQTSPEVFLESGKTYEFQFDYMEMHGGEHVTLSWSNDQKISSKTVIPPSAFSLPEETEEPPQQPKEAKYPGLLGEYYHLDKGDLVFTELQSVYIDNNINFANMDTVLGQRAYQSDYAGARWKGQFVAPETGDYTFYTYSDNGIKITFDGEQILDWWVNKYDVIQTSKTVHLEKGEPYDIKVDYFEYNGGSHVFLYYTIGVVNEEVMEIVPADYFYLPADYEGPGITEVDTSAANLEKGSDQPFGGIIDVKGVNFKKDAKVEIVGLSGISYTKKMIVNTESVDHNSVKFKLPEELTPGSYRIKVITDGVNCISNDRLTIFQEGYTSRPEHPRPDWQRETWMNLNGWWNFSFDKKEVGEDQEWFEADKKEFGQQINVPFCWESELSGIGDPSYLGVAWYQREVVLTDEILDQEKVFLKFGAVDWKCKIWVNGEEAGEHEGGYTPFEVDITDYINEDGEPNNLTVMVEDKASYGYDGYPALVGKQGTNAPCGYTHTSGIWQTVYVEGRSESYLNYVQANPDISAGKVAFDVNVTSDSAQTLKIVYEFRSTLYNDETGENQETGSTFSAADISVPVTAGEQTISLAAAVIPNQKLWNYTEANLYEGTFTLKDASGNILDVVSTYFGQREVSTAKYNNDAGNSGVEYIYVNGEPVYLSGLLDQGFWEEGIYTAPSEEALKYDVQAMRDLDFNMLRKHLKIEEPLQYYWADKLGMFIWQDMPHATNMVPTSQGGEAYGREVFEYALENMLTKITYNHPSVIAVMLFNETWGLQDAYFDNNAHYDKADSRDGIISHRWVEKMYDFARDVSNEKILIEDMSPCNQDHISKTDLNTFHMYPNSYRSTVNDVQYYVDGVKNAANYTRNFYNKKGESHQYNGQPLLNSEYGGVMAYDGDWDVSWCFKFMTDVQRRHDVLSGFVYTEPYDVEYERNGILTYDRRDKVFGYDEVAYGGDMGINDLVQPEYVGFDIDPVAVAKPGSEYAAPILAIRWTPDTLTGQHKVKWRFDATDIYGNNITTDINGEFPIAFEPYKMETNTISFTLPKVNCVGTITAWIENEAGESIAKNFVNVVAANQNSSEIVQYLSGDSVVLRSALSNNEVNAVGETGLTFTLPEDFDLADLNGMRLLTEASSLKGATSSNSAYSQTTVGSERPSDITVAVNGVKVDTVYVQDNPRDIRGTLSVKDGGIGDSGRNSSAGNFGYLINLNISDQTLEAIKATIGDDKKLTVTYEVEASARNRGGIRLYDETNGRYAVSPSLILNPPELFAAEETITAVATEEIISPDADNYSVEAFLKGSGSGFLVRYDKAANTGYRVMLNEDGSVSLAHANGTSIPEGVSDATGNAERYVKITLFDDHIKVYTDGNPEAVIDVYDYAGYQGNVSVASGIYEELVVSPETYEAGEVSGQADVQFTDHYNKDQNTFGSRYETKGNWDSQVTDDNKLYLKADTSGPKAVIRGVEAADVVIEADIAITEKNADGNMGFVFRGNDFGGGADDAYGYYAGIGIEDRSGHPLYGQGFLILGKMNYGWQQLDLVSIGNMDVDMTHRLRIEAVGPRIRIYLEDETEPRIDVYDADYSSGGVAMRGFISRGTYDNVVVSTAPRYRADFINGSLDEWGITNNGWTMDGGQLAAAGPGYALVGNESWSDLQETAEVELAANSTAGLAVHASLSADSKYSGYQVLLDEEHNKLLFVSVRNDAVRVIKEAAVTLEPKLYHLTVTAVNNGYKVYLNDKLELVVSDNAFFRGRSGLVVTKGSAGFQEILVEDKFVYEDNFEDGALMGWDVISGDFSVADNTLFVAAGAGKKAVDGYATWSDYALSGKVKLDAHPNDKSNGGFIFRSSDYGVGQDDLRGYVAGINYNPQANAAAAERSGIEVGDLRYGWRPIVNDTSYPVQNQKWYDFEVQVVDNQIKVYVDYELIHTGIADDAYTYGMFGIRNFRAGMEVKEFRAVPAELYNLDPAELKELIKKANEIAKDSLTDDSQAALVQAIEAAQAVAGHPVTESQIINAYKALEKVIGSLVYRGDKSALEVYYQANKEAAPGAYTPSSFKLLQDALKKAEEVLADQNAAQEIIDEALAALHEAVAGLVKKADKTLLEAYYNEVKVKYDKSLYTEASFRVFEEALMQAAAVLEDEEVSDTQVMEAYLALQNAVFELKHNADGTTLQEYYDSIKDKYNQQDYTKDSFEKFAAALTAANDLLNDGTASQAALDAAWEELKSAEQGLVYRAGLAAYIDSVKDKYDKKAYTASSYAAFETALNHAIEVLEKADASQEEIAAAMKELEAAVSGLGKLGDKKALQEYYNKVKDAYQSADYTKESYAKFTAAMEYVKKVLENEDASEAEVAEALRLLTEAVNGLKKADAPGTGNGGDGSASGNGSGDGSGATSPTGPTKKPSDTGKGLKTGDQNQVMNYVLLCILCLAAAGAAYFGKKRKFFFR